MALRTARNLGLAAWLGGSLMGAVGLNGTAARASDRVLRPALVVILTASAGKLLHASTGVTAAVSLVALALAWYVFVRRPKAEERRDAVALATDPQVG